MAEPSEPPLLSVRDLRVQFRIRDRRAWPWTPPDVLRAVDGVSFDVQAGQTLGIVGESGCGKSTLARACLNLVPVTSGTIAWQGRPMPAHDAAAWLGLRREMQFVSQDPLASLDPRMTVARLIGEPLRIHARGLGAAAVRERVLAAMADVGLAVQLTERHPHELSGGQCQRVSIARALVLEPRLLICDEPVSALDVTIRAQIVALLRGLQERKGLALVFIAHDLAVVRQLCDRVMVLYLGRVMEMASSDALYGRPAHPYTQALLSAVPVPDPRIERLRLASPPRLNGDLPSPITPPSGCVFRTRCAQASEVCAGAVPALRRLDDASTVACVKAPDRVNAPPTASASTAAHSRAR